MIFSGFPSFAIRGVADKSTWTGQRSDALHLHSLSLTFLIEYVREYGIRIHLLGMDDEMW